MNGLETQCVLEAKDGTMWFGTADGLSSYDGFEWHRNLASDGGVLGGWVAAMCNEADGTLDVGGWWGISQLREGKWTRVVPTIGLRFADVRRMTIAPDGSLWAATSWGALVRHGGEWTLFTDPSNATRLEQDARYRFLHVVLLPDALREMSRPASRQTSRVDLTEVAATANGEIWFGTKGGEILRHVPAAGTGSAAADAGSWTLFNESDGLVGGPLPEILPLRDGALWITSASAEELDTFDGKAWKRLALPPGGIAPDGARLLQTRDGVVWVSARYTLYAFRDGAWQTYRGPDVPVPTALNLIAESRDGALWLVGPNTNIERIDYETPRWSTLHDLNFQSEDAGGGQWFLHRDGRVVRRQGSVWTSFGVEDGLMDAPVAVIGTRAGVVWALGSHEHIAATARFEGGKWTREVHPDFSWGIDWRAVFESSDGSLWIGAAVDSSGPVRHRDGILQYHDGTWSHHHQPGRSPRAEGATDPKTLLPASHRPEPIEKFTFFGETRDGRVWAGRNVLVFHDGHRWGELMPSDTFRFGVIESMLTTRERDLWVGTRQYGVLRYDGRTWRSFQGRGSLMANSIVSLVESPDGSIWAATDRGFSRFDGNSWMDDAMPDALNVAHERGALKVSRSGQLWINHWTASWNQRAWTKSTPPAPNSEFWTASHAYAGPPPRTFITAGAERVAQPGNISILWAGTSPWRPPSEVRLQYSFRLDGGAWSAFTSEFGHAFFTLPSGRHHFEVRARDQDFNVDPTPAALDFVVLPPVWRQIWFVGTMVGLVALLAAQTFRVLLEKRRLQKAHALLEERVRQRTAELEFANRELESFSYSISHDLRSPLRSIDGFSRALLADYEAVLDDEGRENLRTIRVAAQRMGRLIDAMLVLSRVTRGTLRRRVVNLSQLAEEIMQDLARGDPSRQVAVSIAPDAVVRGDATLLRNALENLLGNAWKFTANSAHPRIEFGVTERQGQTAYFVRDNGAGFDREMARKLFGAFQRFHPAGEFPGTGIGLATVQRIIHRHGGIVEAESRPGQGAIFYFTIGPDPEAST